VCACVCVCECVMVCVWDEALALLGYQTKRMQVCGSPTAGKVCWEEKASKGPRHTQPKPRERVAMGDVAGARSAPCMCSGPRRSRW
jgi:hypothetical protein